MKKSIVFLTAIKFFYITTLFVSSTFAFFSDSVLNQNNRITLGNLRASVVFSNTFDTQTNNLSGTIVDLKTNTNPLFSFADQAQPGDFIEGYVRIVNVGTITMDYLFFFDITEDLNSFSSILSLEIQKVNPSSTTTSFTGSEIGTVIEGENLLTDSLEIYRIKLSILPNATDVFNDPSKVFTFAMDFTMYAWQANFPEGRPELT